MVAINDDMTRKIIKHIADSCDSVIVIDLSYQLHRFSYVFKDLSVVKGGREIPTGHIYGFLNQLCYLYQKFDNPAVILAVDGYDSDRKELLPEYKEGRGEKRINVRADVDDIISLSSVFPNMFIGYRGDKEADDMIYSVTTVLSHLFIKNGITSPIFILGNDKDLYQGVRENVSMIKKFGKGKNWFRDAVIVDRGVVKEEFNGVSPENLALFRSISGGDKSDRITPYNRFPKKLAAIIAENYEIVREEGKIRLEAKNDLSHVDKSDMDKLNSKWFKVIEDDYSRLDINYQVSKAKEFEFKLVQGEKLNAGDLADFYDLRSYRQNLEFMGIELR